MRTTALSAVLLSVALAAGCGEQPTTYTLPVHGDALLSQGALQNFRTHASGDQEVPARDTEAQGQLVMQLSKDGETLSYKLIASNIENILQAHLHMAPAGSNGGIVVWLYPSAPPSQLIPGRHDGILAEGEITASSLVGALAGRSMSDLIDAIEAGNIYVNVHTSQFPPGEIRGQVR